MEIIKKNKQWALARIWQDAKVQTNFSSRTHHPTSSSSSWVIRGRADQSSSSAGSFSMCIET